MMRWTCVVLFGIAGIVLGEQIVNGPLFLPAGKLAVGGEFGHIRAVVDIVALHQQHVDFTVGVDRAIREATNPLSWGFCGRVVNRRALERLNVTLQRIHHVASYYAIDLGTDMHPEATWHPDWAEPWNGSSGRINVQEEEDRHKRMAVAAFLFGAVGAGVSLYTLHEVMELRQKMEENNDIIFHRLDAHERVIEQIVSNEKVFKEALGRLDAKLTTLGGCVELDDRVDFVVTMHEQTIHDFVGGLFALQGFLPPSLLSPEALREGLQNVNKQAKAEGFEVLELSAYTHHFSYLVIENQIEILVHVPIVDVKFDLFEYVALPSPIDQMFMIMTSQDRFLATGVEANETGLTMHDMNECVHFGNLNQYVCPSQIIRRDVLGTTCLGALYSGNNQSRVLCDVKFTTSVEPMYKLRGNLFVAFNNDQYVYCPGDTQNTRAIVPKSKLMTVPKGCKLSLKEGDYQAYRDLNVDIPAPSVTRIDINETFYSISEPHRDLVKETLEKFENVNLNEIRQMHLQQSIEKDRNIIFWSVISVVFAIAVLALVLFLSGYLKFKFCPTKRVDRRNDIEV